MVWSILILPEHPRCASNVLLFVPFSEKIKLGAKISLVERFEAALDGVEVLGASQKESGLKANSRFFRKLPRKLTES